MQRSPTRVITRTVCCLGLAVSAALILGCGGKPTGTVKGTVKYKGNLLKGGYVSFYGTDGGKAAASAIEDNGTYVVNNVPGGTCKVCVDTESLRPPAGMGPGGPGAAAMKDKGPPPDAKVPEGYTPSSPAAAALERNKRRYVQIPDSYAKPDTTPLSFDVTGGEQTYDIDLN